MSLWHQNHPPLKLSVIEPVNSEGAGKALWTPFLAYGEGLGMGLAFMQIWYHLSRLLGEVPLRAILRP
ncbi:MAG: hypothetical protein BroJett018_39950 [Chloroflexota bacterium]|nr:MAG: hypothetical protein BroJett018_39950 [Chloroflexota bacterium]